MIVSYLTAASIVIALLMLWVGVQALSRRFEAGTSFTPCRECRCFGACDTTNADHPNKG